MENIETLKHKFQALVDFIKYHRCNHGDLLFSTKDANSLFDSLKDIEETISKMETVNYSDGKPITDVEREKIENYNKYYNLPKDSPSIEKISFTTDDKVNHPSHYTWLKDKCGIEVIDITRHLNFNLGNVIKYVLRSGHKKEEGISIQDKEIEDLQKAVFYLNDEISRLSNLKKETKENENKPLKQ